MVEGKLIKFYREKAGLTQAQLCEGICSVTHLSKIERGITEYSGEITQLLSQRLQICLEDEFVRYQHLHEKLKQWQETFVMQQMKDSVRLKKELEEEVLIELPDFHVFYQLLSVRYYLQNFQIDKAFMIIRYLQKQESSLSPHDTNMLKHILGMYYFHIGQYRDCILVLKSIDPSQYQQFEYYYHLALAYHLIDSNIISYYYVEKALHYFRKTLNVIRIIDTETIMLLQLNSKELHDFEETKARYGQLLRTCDSIHEIDRKSKLLNNLGFEFFKRNQYQDAAELYREAMDLMDEQTPHYLTTLDGYINACQKGNLLSNEMLMELAKKGLAIAKSTKAYHWVFFELHLYQLTRSEDEYYQFMEKTALPFLKNMGFTMFVEHYERELFQFYNKKGEAEKALEIARSYIQNNQNDFLAT